MPLNIRNRCTIEKAPPIKGKKMPDLHSPDSREDNVTVLINTNRVCTDQEWVKPEEKMCQAYSLQKFLNSYSWVCTLLLFRFFVYIGNPEYNFGNPEYNFGNLEYNFVQPCG